MGPEFWSCFGLTTNLLLLLSINLNSLCFVHSFNLDLETRLIQRGPVNSMFGYSVDLYKSGNGETWMLIGAPKADTQSHQPGVVEGGVVFKCSTSRATCEILRLDTTSAKNTSGLNKDQITHNMGLNGTVTIPVDSKNYQWLGATVVASRQPNDDRVLACAPRYIYFSTSFDYGTTGTCFLAQNEFTKIDEYSPCRTAQWGYHRLGYCLAGFSAAIPKQRDRVFIAAPGSWYLQGSFISQELQDADRRDRTGPADPHFDIQYMGYSSVSGDFNGDGVDDVAMGRPRGGDGLQGEVNIWDQRAKTIQNITGKQIGSYFGAALAVVDVDGDGRLDLIIGAPMFESQKEDEGGSLKTKYEVGAVYVYFQMAGRLSDASKSVFYAGESQWARLGSSLASAGDLNGDGFGDFVAGAPFDGPDKKGAIYVFNGQKAGIGDKPTQIIYADQVDRELSSLGFSMSGNIDVDNNGYPDLVVGTYRSDRAVLFKARPVVKVLADIMVEPKQLDLDDKSCSLPGAATKATCGKIRYCFKYSGREVPASLSLKVLLHLDKEKGLRNRTMFMSPHVPSPMERFLSLEKDQKKCEDTFFYVKDDSRIDKLTPISVLANFSLVDARGTGRLTPVLDASVPNFLKDEVEIKKNCGHDLVCVPDLQLDRQIMMCSGRGADYKCHIIDTFTIGHDNHLNLTVSVRNRGEDAFDTRFFMEVPAGLDYEQFFKLTPAFPALCTSQEGLARGSTLVICEIGNPMPARTRMRLSFKIVVTDYSMAKIVIKMRVNSTNEEPEALMHDNELEVVIPVEVKPVLTLNGGSDPDDVPYNVERDRRADPQFESEIGPNVTHIYEVRNDGDSTLYKVKVQIFWPQVTANNLPLLYLMRYPWVDGPGECVILDAFNQKKIAPEYSKDALIQEAQRRNRPYSFSDSGRRFQRRLHRKQQGRRQQQIRRRRQTQKTGGAPLRPNFDDDDYDYYVATQRPPSEPTRVTGYPTWDGHQPQQEKTTTTPSPNDLTNQKFRTLISKIRASSEGADEAALDLRRLHPDCNELMCTRIECTITNLERSKSAVIRVQSWLWINTLIEQAFTSQQITSVAVAYVDNLGGRFNIPASQLPTKTAVVTTTATPEDTTRLARGAPWWLYLIAILAGITALLLIVLCCWKFGFFKRNRPPTMKADKKKPPEAEYYGYPQYGQQL